MRVFCLAADPFVELQRLETTERMISEGKLSHHAAVCGGRATSLRLISSAANAEEMSEQELAELLLEVSILWDEAIKSWRMKALEEIDVKERAAIEKGRLDRRLKRARLRRLRAKT